MACEAVKPCGRRSGEAGGLAGGVIVCEINTRGVQVPVGLLFLSDHCKHLSCGVVSTLCATVVSLVIGTCAVLQDFELGVNSREEVRTELRAITGEKG